MNKFQVGISSKELAYYEAKLPHRLFVSGITTVDTGERRELTLFQAMTANKDLMLEFRSAREKEREQGISLENGSQLKMWRQIKKKSKRNT